MSTENGTSRQQEVEGATADLLSRLRAARTDFESFLRYVWSNDANLELADFHLEAIETYPDMRIKFSYWEAARGHGKSLITTAFATFMLGQDVNHRIKIICANDKEARKRLFEIKDQIENNPLVTLTFPHLRKPVGGEWNKSRVVLDRDISMKDPSLEAMGVMSGSLGSRATVIIVDDIVDMRNSILQPQLREHVRQKFFGEIIPLLEPEGILRAVGTPWTLFDVNAIMKEKFHLIGPHAVGNAQDKFAPIWPYKFAREHLVQIHDDALGPAEYARAYLCQALTKDTVPIQASWIKFYDAKLLGDPNQLFGMNIYDLAIEQSAKNDYFAFVSLLWCQKRNFIFVADAWMDRLSFRNQARAVVDNARIWLPQEVVIEKGGYQGSLQSYLEEEAEVPMQIWPFRNRGRSKERRVVEASPWFEKGKIFFHPKFHPKKNPDIMVTAPIIPQTISFPYDKFDDLIDCLCMGVLTITEMMPELFEKDEAPDESDISLTLI